MALGESRGAGLESSDGLREREGEEHRTRIVCAEEELRRAQLEIKSLLTTLNK